MRTALRLAPLALALAWPAGLAPQGAARPAGAGPSPSAAALPSARPPAPGAPGPAAPADPEARARGVLAGRAAAWGLDPAEAAGARLALRHDLGEGPVALAFRRVVDGVEVLGEQAGVVLDRAGAPVAVLGALDGGRPRPGDGFTLGEAAAAARALAAVEGLAVTPGALRGGAAAGPWRRYEAGAAGATARVRRAWVPDEGALAATWLVEVVGPPGEPLRAELALLGDDGRVRSRRPLTWSQAFSYRAWADAAAPHLPWDGPTGLAGTPHPTGRADGAQPAPVAQALVSLAHASATRADPWLPDGAAETTGNNAEVYANLDGLQGFDPAADVRGAATAAGVFDHPADLAAGPSAGGNRQAGLVQAFYLVNFLHDWLLDAGFDEASGNAQADNLGRGGLGGDPLVVEGQDPFTVNQAMMLTPADGGVPVMKVGIFGAITARYLAWVGAPPAGRPANEEATRSAFGAQAFDLVAPLVPVDDGVAPAGDGCDDGAWITQDLSGRIALLDAAACLGSPTCSCADKAARAEARGAAGVLIANEGPGYLFLSTQAPDARVTVPVLGLTQATAEAVRAAAAAGPVPVRMVRSPSAPARDGLVDGLLLTHEWGHLLSNRLAGAGLGLSGPQGRALGEGWSDFLALLLATRPEDALTAAGARYGGVYTYGSWVLGGAEALFGGPNQSYYFGMRRVPYTTDPGRNPLTFRHVQAGAEIPRTTPGGAAIPFADNGLGNAEEHNAGEVWATMLWECWAALLEDTLGPSRRITFDEAQRRMRGYLVASLKLTGATPTFLEVRDALLAVARAGDPADEARFWQAFARRGAGEGAEGPTWDAADLAPVTESYRSPYPEPPPGGGDGGGCQAGGAGALSLLAVLGLLAGRRRRPGRPALRGGQRILFPPPRIHRRTGGAPT